MSIFDKLEEDCKEFGLACQITNTNGKTYATISMDVCSFVSGAIWQYNSNQVVQKYFPKASYVRSTKDDRTMINSATYCLGDIIEILKG